MISWAYAERLKREIAEVGRSSFHMPVVLSLIFSLAAVAIISKKHLTSYPWVDVAAFAVPIPIVLYFENRIVRFGIFTCVAAIVLPLTAALLFGI